MRFFASSFSERRAAIDSELLYYVLRRFSDTDNGNDAFLCKGRKLLAMDGVNFNTALNKDAPSFMPVPNSTKGGYNQYKATVMLDLLSHQTVDMVLNPIRNQDEHGDAAFMMAWNDFPPCIVICDRLYASYPLIADFQQKGMDFVLRTKQNVGALKPLQALPMKELDVDLEFVLTDSQSKASKEKGHIYVNTGSKRGKENSPKTYVSRFSYPLPYIMHLRVVRGRLPNGDLETLLTSLSRDEFSATEVMELYRLRWREEIFFRHIKYDCGASRIKCKKEDYSRQELYGHFIASAAVWKIINSIALEQKTGNAYEYKINIKMATYLVRYLEDGRLELSNNRAERSIKPFVMGRKNWLFANTPAGAQSSAVIYSLIETAKENQLDPYRYLLWVLKNVPALSQTDESWAEKLLPAKAPQECYIPQN